MGRLKKAVAEIIEDEGHEDIKAWCEQVLNKGCVVGCVMSLMDYEQTSNFFDDYEEEIKKIIEAERRTEMAVFNIFEDYPHTIKNNIVWFVFERLVEEYLNEM